MSSILIVEDEPDYLKIVTFQLSSSGVAIIGASTGAEAIQKAEQGEIGILLLDCVLPDMKGIEIAKKIRSLPGKEEIPVIFATASESAFSEIPDDMPKMKKFLKPVSQDDLVRAIQSFLQ